MGKFLTALPVNYGYYNLSSVETYPTGGSGPVAYGPTSYFGSDPLPPRSGDSINNALDLGNLSAYIRTITLSNTHGGKSRIQSTFYQFILTAPRVVQIVQNYSPTSYQANTNKNTIISVYKVEDGTHRRELPINDDGVVYKENSIADDDSYVSSDGYLEDYPTGALDVGTYVILITNDIKFLETTYSFTLTTVIADWRFVAEPFADFLDFSNVTGASSTIIDFGSVVYVKPDYPYSSTSGLGYTRAGVSP